MLIDQCRQQSRKQLAGALDALVSRRTGKRHLHLAKIRELVGRILYPQAYPGAGRSESVVGEKSIDHRVFRAAENRGATEGTYSNRHLVLSIAER